MELARTGASIGQLSNVWGPVQPQRHYFTLAVPTRSNAGGVASCLHPADQRIGRHVDVETPRPPSRQQRWKTSFRDFARSATPSSKALSRSQLGSPISPIRDNETPPLRVSSRFGRALSLPGRRRLTPASEFGESSIAGDEARQHGRDELGGINGFLSGFARKRLGVGDQITMQRRRQLDCQALPACHLRLRRASASPWQDLKRRVRGRDRG